MTRQQPRRRLRSAQVLAIVGILSAGCLAEGVAVAGPPPPPKPTQSPAQVVVKVDRSDGYTISDVTSKFPVKVESAILASRGIYLTVSTSSAYTSAPGSTQNLANQIAHANGVTYAEPNYPTTLDDTQYHAWPDGRPHDGSFASMWQNQQAARQLALTSIHQQTMGAGEIVAVLDTGADPDQPALRNRLVKGWNYVEDDADTADLADHPTDSSHPNGALGHGTFVSGTVALVAPEAQIMPMRVLNSDGEGNLFVVAQAIIDATNDGANVINLSLGTASQVQSRLLNDAVNFAQQHNVVVVGAAGNDADDQPHFPAASPNVISVAALNSAYSGLASFSDYGGWVDVAAPGSAVFGPLPDGRWARWQGTSIASPFVAGEAALVQSAYPSLPYGPRNNAISNTADKMTQTKIGHGRIDIVAALQQAAKQVPPHAPKH